MPRPTSRGMETESSNPFQGFLRRIREKKIDKENRKQGEIIDTAARNETDVINALLGISFPHSRLPREYLEYKSDPGSALSDLEAARERAVQTLSRPMTPMGDISPIDNELVDIAYRFKNAVEQGDVNAAFAAKAALNVGVMKIRSRIPAVQSGNLKNFVNKSAEYLREWGTLIDMATAYDAEENNVAKLTETVDQQEAELERTGVDFENKLSTDPKFQTAFENIRQNDSDEGRQKWSKQQWDVFYAIVQQRIRRATLALSRTSLLQKKALLVMSGEAMDAMRTKLASLKDTSPVDLLNSYNEAMDGFFNEMAKADTEINERLKAITDVEGRLKQLEQGAGNIALNEFAAEGAERILEEIREKQQAEVENYRPNGNLMKTWGLKTQEEIEAEKLQNQQKQEVTQQVVRQERKVLFEG